MRNAEIMHVTVDLCYFEQMLKSYDIYVKVCECVWERERQTDRQSTCPRQKFTVYTCRPVSLPDPDLWQFYLKVEPRITET